MSVRASYSAITAVWIASTVTSIRFLVLFREDYSSILFVRDEGEVEITLRGVVGAVIEEDVRENKRSCEQYHGHDTRAMFVLFMRINLIASIKGTPLRTS